jgi:hypothetical protein
MASNEFSGMLYRSQAEMLRAIAEMWITAGGSNSDTDVAAFLASASDDDLAAEAIEAWGLDRPTDYGDGVSHMASEGYSRSDLAGAFADFRAARIILGS